MAEYETTDIPLETIATKYFNITHRDKVSSMARHSEFPFPVYRMGGQRSQWMVNIADLAEYIDKARAKAREDFELFYREKP